MDNPFLDFDWDEYENNPSVSDLNFNHSLFSSTVEIVSLKDFLDQCVVVYKDSAIYPGFKKGLIELPVLIFRNYDNVKKEVINLMGLSFFETLKYRDYLFIEKKESGIYVLRGKMPEDFYTDRATRNNWKTFAEAAERRRVERRTTGWIPDADIGR